MRFNPKLALTICPPSALSIELSSRCNIQCLCCSVGQGKIPKGDMSVSNFKRIVNLLPKNIKQLSFSHRGDPTMNVNTPEMIQYAYSKKLVTDLYTNGLLLNNYIEKFINCGLTTIRIDLDGSSKESYESYRVGSNFDRVKKNIRELVTARNSMKKRYPENIYIICVVSSLNEHEISEMQDMAEKLNVDGILFKTAITNYGGKYYNDSDIQNNLVPKNIAFQRQKRKHQGFTCPFLWRGTILHNGDFIMCTADFEGEYRIGNILEENSFEKIYYGRKAHNTRFKILQGDGLCRTCSVVDENHYIKEICRKFNNNNRK